MQREGLELFPLVAFVKNAPIRAEKHAEFLFWEKKRKKKKFQILHNYSGISISDIGFKF